MSQGLAFPPSDGGWQRPADWLGFPTIGADEWQGLLAVSNDAANLIAFKFTGAYTVDWGDGSASENVATGVVAQHTYDYAALPASSLSSRGYKQVVVRVTPQAAQQLTSFDLAQLNTGLAVATPGQSINKWLDVRVNTPNCASMQFNAVASQVSLAMLEQVTIQAFSGTSLAGLFIYLYGLQSVPVFDTSLVTNFSDMFNGCISLQVLPLLNTGAGTNFTNFCTGCSQLRTVPALNTAAGTLFTDMFSVCGSLQEFPLINTAAGTNFNNMFNGCGALSALPALNVAAGTSFTSMLAQCASLASAPFVGATRAISYDKCKLSTAAIVDIFTALGTASGAQTITVTSNFGGAALTAPDLAIATGKGWTVSA